MSPFVISLCGVSWDSSADHPVEIFWFLIYFCSHLKRDRPSCCMLKLFICLSLTLLVNKPISLYIYIYINISNCVDGHCFERDKPPSYAGVWLWLEMFALLANGWLIMSLFYFLGFFIVAGDDHKPKTCVNMCIGMKHIVCIYCLLAFLKAQNNHGRSPLLA